MLTPKKQANNNMSIDNTRLSFNFPHEKLTKCEGEPNNAAITTIKRQLYANAMSIECTLGCGTLGYLGIIMPTTDYRAKQAITAPDAPFKPFTKPTPDNTADDDIYKEQQRALREYLAVDAKLKQVIVNAVKETYLTALEDDEVGLGPVTSKALLAYIVNEYGAVTLEDLDANREKLNEPWNSEQPIRMLWDRIKECQRISTAGDETITDRAAMFTALKLLDATGLYTTYTTNWRQTYPIQTAWNMNTFHEYFNHAGKDRKKNLTTKDAGFHGANAATKQSYNDKKTEKPTPTVRSETNFVDPDTGRKVYYCWSHGANLNPNHISAKCKFPKEGHQKEATWMDMMGGCCDFKIGKNRKQKHDTATD